MFVHSGENATVISHTASIQRNTKDFSRSWEQYLTPLLDFTSPTTFLMSYNDFYAKSLPILFLCNKDLQMYKILTLPSKPASEAEGTF